jgi:hypothetical protein
VWAEVTALLTSPARLRQLADDYLGLPCGDSGSQAGQVAWLDGQITQLRGRMTSQVAELIKGGLDAQVVKEAVAQLEDDLAMLQKRRDDIARSMAEGDRARELVSSMDRLAEHATGRLDSMTLDERRDALALLDVRVTVQASGGLHITGTVCELDIPAEPDDRDTKILHSHSPPGLRVPRRVAPAPALHRIEPSDFGPGHTCPSPLLQRH